MRYYLEDADFISREYPKAAKLFKKVIAERKGTKKEQKEMKELWQEISFEIIEAEPENYFKIEEAVEIELPDYAPIFDDQYCSSCGEKLMTVKAVEKDGDIFCKECTQSSYYQLDGRGIVEKS